MPLSTQKKLDLVRSDPKYLPGWHQPKPEDEFLYYNLGMDFDRYIEMRRDAHIRSKLEKRQNSLLARPVLFEGGTQPKDLEAIEIAKAIHDDIKYESLCGAIVDTGQIIGFSVVKVDEVQRDVEITIDGESKKRSIISVDWQYVPQYRFSFAYHEPDDRTIPVATGEELDPANDIIVVNGYELRLLTQRNPILGERCPKSRFLFFRFGLGQSSPWGLGLGYSLYPWWAIKREAVKAWILHGDRTGESPAQAEMPENFDPINNPVDRDIEAKVQNFLQGISPNNWVILPHGIRVSLLSDLVDKPDVLERLIALANSEMSKVLLGEVSYSEKGTGSYAANASQVDDIQSTTIDSDANLLDEQSQVGLWDRLIRLNAPKAKRVIVRRESRADVRQAEAKKSQQGELNDTLDRDKKLLDMGWRRSPESMQELFGNGYEQLQGDKEKPPLITTLGIGGIQAFTSILSAAGLQATRETTIAALTALFGIDKAVAETIVPAKSDQPTLDSIFGGDSGTPVTPPTPEPAMPTFTENFGAIIDRVIKWQGLEIGLEYLPGQVRFPGKKFSRKLKSGYGHIRNHIGADGEALDCYVHPDLVDGGDGGSIFAVSQLDQEGKFDELKLMLGWGSIEAAELAYLREMPADRLEKIEELAIGDLEKYRKKPAKHIGDEDQDEFKENFMIVELDMTPQQEELNLLGNVLGAIAGGVEEFAVAKKNCNPAKSHFCVGKTGVGSCVPLSRQCAIPATGVVASTAQSVNTANPKAKGRAKKATTPAAPAAPTSNPVKPSSPNKRSKDLVDLDDALTSGDFDKVADITDRLWQKAQKVRLTPGENNKILKLLFDESGYNGKPTVVTETDLDKVIAGGAIGMVRGVSMTGLRGTRPGVFGDQFRYGDYHTGNGIYGDGTYVGHSGTFDTQGNFQARNTARTLKSASSHVAKHGYINSTTDNIRMALPKDANIISQSQFSQEVVKVNNAIGKWERDQLSRIGSTGAAGLDHRKMTVSKSGGLPDRSFVEYPNPNAGQPPLKLLVKQRSNGRYAYWDDDANGFVGFAASPKDAFDAFANQYGDKYGIGPNSAGRINAGDIAKKAKRMREVLLGDLGNGSSGQLGVIKGYDAIALNRSYEPKAFMNLLNRSKVITQDKPVSFARLKKQGVA